MKTSLYETLPRDSDETINFTTLTHLFILRYSNTVLLYAYCSRLGKKPERRRHGESLTLHMKYAFSHFRYFFVAQEFVLKNSSFLTGDSGYSAFASKNLNNGWSIFMPFVHSFIFC